MVPVPVGQVWVCLSVVKRTFADSHLSEPWHGEGSRAASSAGFIENPCQSSSDIIIIIPPKPSVPSLPHPCPCTSLLQLFLSQTGEPTLLPSPLILEPRAQTPGIPHNLCLHGIPFQWKNILSPAAAQNTPTAAPHHQLKSAFLSGSHPSQPAWHQGFLPKCWSLGG